MLKKLSLIALSLTVAVLFTSTMMSDNGKAGKTGSPGELTCVDCHADYTVNTGGGSITVSGITGGTYTPGTTYSLSVVVSRTGSTVFGLGFEALTASNTNAGSLVITNSAQTQLKSATVSGNSRQSVVHQLNGGATSNTHTFTFNWVAPAAGTGNVTFYFAGIAGDGDGNESGDYVYNSSLALTEGGGCLPPAQPGAIAGTATVCAGSSQTYSVAAVSGATDYIWTLPGGWTGSSTTSSITVTAGSAGGAITVAAHNACGTSTVSSMNLTVNSSVTPTVSISANPGSTICSGTSVTFTATPTNGGTTPSYQWKLNGANIGTNSATYTNAALANGNTVSCVMTSNVACASTTTATSNTITMVVSGTVTPTVSIAANPGATICSGTSVTFTATPTNGGTTPAYQWKLNGSNVGTNSATYTNAALANGNTVSCVMTSNSGCASTPTATSNTVTMVVNASVTPTVSIAANPGTTICSGTSVTFTATATNGGTTPSYQWKLNGANVGTNSATYTNAALANGNTVSCVMTSNATCTSAATATSNIITMAVSSSVAPSVSIAANPGSTICSGTSVTFTATPTNGGTTPAYQWKLNGTNVGTNSATYTNAALATGDIITCVLTSNSTCATTPSATSNAITMSISASVAPQVSIAANPGATICSGTSVTFTATPTNGGTTPAYQWKLNGTNTGTNSATYTNATLVNGDIVTCVLTSNSTCASTPTATSNAITMTISASVTPSVVIAANPGSTICSGTSVTFTATPTNGGTTPAYQWKLNGANVGTNSATYTNGSLATGDIVTCELTSNSACATTPNATSNAITMIVSGSVAPTVSIAADPGSSICTGSNVIFTATATNVGTTPAYQWTLNSVNVGTNSATYSNNSLATGDQIQCTLTSNSTCASTSTAVSQVITMTVNSSFTPIVTPNGATTFCAGGNVILSASTGSSYLWSNGETTQTITVNGSGSYSVTVTSGSCSGSSTAVDVTVNPLPIVTMATLSPVCSTDAAFTLSGGNPSGGTYSGNGVSGGSFDPAVAGVGTTVITYSYSDASSCTNSATTNQVVTNCGGGGCTSAPDRPRHISGPTFVICGSTGIVYSVAPDTAATSYNWTVPANAVITANNGNSITVDFIQGFTNGFICVTATNACGTSDDRCKFVHQVQMRVPPIHGPREICPDNLISDYTIDPVVGAVSYIWSVTGGATLTSLDNNATVDFTNATNSWIVISVEVTNACGDVRSRSFLVNVRDHCGHHDDDEGDDDRIANRISSFEIYPNPNAGEFAVQVSSTTEANAEISVIDMIGKTQILFEQTLDSGINTIEVNAGHLSKGIYFLKISIPGMPVEMKQVVIQN